ncbi:Sclerostin domain-containing protein 1 Ectodermal BMP inhibitor [Larimichthys crocea]|uniref:Sclerostin n=1 Tax=Larimichthys crocea TaxID=215358 RepID=A0A6G0HXR3_LARCR|nr:Sclerostin domain-containing protein 1 Ectodermal BMP inhibitor [Larimichthys crocea]
MQVCAALLVSSAALLLLQGCCAAARGWRVLKNDGTELLPEYSTRTAREEAATPPTDNSNSNSNSSNSNSNSMNNRPKNGGRTANTVTYSASELSLHARAPPAELHRSRQVVESNASDYRCIPAHSRTRRVQLQCPNGNTRTYKIRVVTSCKCKRFRPHHNQSEAKEVPKRQRNKKQHSRSPQDRSKNNTPLTGNSY